MFLDNLKKYFRVNEGKEAIKPEYSSPKNEYYAKVSERFGTAQMVLYVVLTVVVLVSLMINSEWITYENFYYFFSDMGDYITASDSEIEDVLYNVDRKQVFSVYNGKFAVAGNSGLKLYTASGRLIIDDGDEISNPKLEESDVYLLMYDQGHTEFRVYNIFTEVFSADTDFPIHGADISDSGNFALVTSDEKNASSVHLYSNKFKLQKTYRRADYVVDVALNSAGSRIAILSYSYEDGKIVTNISMGRTSKNDFYAEMSFKGSFPLYCGFTADNKFLAVCNDRIMSFGDNGDVIEEYLTGYGGEVVFADVNEFGAASVIKNQQKFILTVFDRNGKEVYNNILSGAVEQIALNGNSVFLKKDVKIEKIDLITKHISDVENSDFGAFLLPKNEDELLLCLPARVKYIKFE